MIFKPSDILVTIGDSITDCGRNRPVGSGAGLGDGYVKLLQALINGCHPESPVAILNTGISGQRVKDLLQRWQTDVLDLKPNWVSIMIGINDVWRQFDNPLSKDQVLLPEYEAGLEKMVQQTKPHVDGIILMTPFYIESNKKDPMRKKMDQYGSIVKKCALKHKTIFVDTQAAFDAYTEHLPTQSLCGDRVHPNTTGHMVIAKAFLTAVGFQF
jgi:lysophospholipase L1-like esterase